MKEFERVKIGRPFKESPEYVETLLMQCANVAMDHVKTSRHIVWNYRFACAVAAVAIVVGIFALSSKDVTDALLDNSPLEIFLASITDDQAMQIEEGFVVDIPEYYR